MDVGAATNVLPTSRRQVLVFCRQDVGSTLQFMETPAITGSASSGKQGTEPGGRLRDFYAFCVRIYARRAGSRLS